MLMSVELGLEDDRHPRSTRMPIWHKVPMTHDIRQDVALANRNDSQSRSICDRLLAELGAQGRSIEAIEFHLARTRSDRVTRSRSRSAATLIIATLAELGLNVSSPSTTSQLVAKFFATHRKKIPELASTIQRTPCKHRPLVSVSNGKSK